MTTKTLISLLTLLSISSSSLAEESASCKALEAGNLSYASGRFDQALDTFKSVEQVDRSGKDVCTASVYATVATIYRLRGNGEVARDVGKAAADYKQAAK